MPAIIKKKTKKPIGTKPSPKKTKTLKKKNLISKKKKLISSQLGKTVVKKSKTRNAYNPIKANRGVVFIKHIPHGFYEEQLKKYFEQFGAVTRTRVARSERSGRSKGYAFVEFRVPDVAKIAAETMDNYLMFKHVLKTAYIPPEEQKFNYFRNTVRMEKGPNGVERLVTPKTKRIEAAVAKTNTTPTDKQHQNRVVRALYKLKKAEEKYSSNGIELNLLDLAHSAPVISNKLTKKQQKKTKMDDSSASPSSTTKSPSPGKSGKKGKIVNTADSTISDLLGETIDDVNTSDDDDFNPNSTIEADTIDEYDSDEQGALNESSDDETNTISVEKNPKIKQSVGKSLVVLKKEKKNTQKKQVSSTSETPSPKVEQQLKNKSNKRKLDNVKLSKSNKRPIKMEILSTDNTPTNSPPVITTATKKRLQKDIKTSVATVAATVLPPKTKKSALLANGGVQKNRTKKVLAPTKKSSTKITKMKLAATEIEQQKNAGTIKKLKAVDLKKKKK